MGYHFSANTDSSNDENILKVNNECYNHYADFWDRFPFPNAIPEALKKYYQPSLGTKVLDIGSGTGVLARWLKDQNFNVLCIDPSIEMVTRCQKKGLNTIKSTFQDFNSAEKFSVIFAILSLIHVPKKGIQPPVGENLRFIGAGRPFISRYVGR